MCYLCGRPLLKTVCFHTPRHGGMAAKTLKVFRMCPNVPRMCSRMCQIIFPAPFYREEMRPEYMSEHQELRTPHIPLIHSPKHNSNTNALRAVGAGMHALRSWMGPFFASPIAKLICVSDRLHGLSARRDALETGHTTHPRRSHH